MATSKLLAGDQVRTLDGRWIPVDGVEDSGKVEPVFNLQVEGAHTYFVRAPGSDVATTIVG